MALVLHPLLFFFQKILSYVRPIKVAEFPSEVSEKLELVLYRGQLMLDTETANYSYGNLHTVMEAALAEARKSGHAIKQILILGFGGGDAAQILGKHYPQAAITGVELDPAIIKIYDTYYKSRDIRLVQQGAQEFLHEEMGLFDLIICDVFISLEKPLFTQSQNYYSLIKERLTSDGLFVQNTMSENHEVKDLVSHFKKTFPDGRSSKVLEQNYLLFSN